VYYKILIKRIRVISNNLDRRAWFRERDESRNRRVRDVNFAVERNRFRDREGEARSWEERDRRGERPRLPPPAERAQEASQVRRRTHSHDEHVHMCASICVVTAATGTR